MGNFLLSAAVLLQLLSGSATASSQWLEQQDVRRLRIDSVSLGLVRYTIGQEPNAWMRNQLETQLSVLVQGIQSRGEAPLDFSERHATAWAHLLAHPVLVNAGASAPMVQVYAIAQIEGLTLVELQAQVPPGLQDAGIQHLAL